MYYLYHLKQNEKIAYVGLTVNIKDRIRQHKKSKPKHSFFVIEEYEDVSLASINERIHIKKYDTYKNGWNKTPGGEYKDCSGYDRKTIGGVKKGTVPWNKGKKGYKIHNEKTKQLLSEKNIGENNANGRLTNEDVICIIKLYKEKPTMTNVGKVMKNGKKMSYEWSFSIMMAEKYLVTPENIVRIIKKRSWKNIWSKIENDDVC